MSEAVHTPTCRSPLAIIRASGHVIVDANFPTSDLLVLAGAAAQWGASVTVRNAHMRDEGELEKIAAAGRGHVTFDLAE